jgi:hypothetical protein
MIKSSLGNFLKNEIKTFPIKDYKDNKTLIILNIFYFFASLFTDLLIQI